MQKFSLRSTLLSTTGALLLCSSAFADDLKMLVVDPTHAATVEIDSKIDQSNADLSAFAGNTHPIQLTQVESLVLHNESLNLNVHLNFVLKHENDTGPGTLTILATDEKGTALGTLELNLENLNFTGVDSDAKTPDATDAEKAGDADKTADATKAGDAVNGEDTDQVADADKDSDKDADKDSDKDAEKSEDTATDDGTSTASAASTQG